VVKQAGGSPCYTSAFFAVHPEHHNEGIGSAINDYFVRRVSLPQQQYQCGFKLTIYISLGD
jgi:hypothetical protein